MLSTSFSGTVDFTCPETDEVFYIQYEGVYEPAHIGKDVESSHDTESHLELLDLPPELESIEARIKELAWQDFHNSY
jgi:hypothetical protein